MSATMDIRLINVPDAPEIEGLVYRHFRGEADYPAMVDILQGCKEADGVERVDSVEEVARNYAHLTNCDPYQDMIFVEINGEVIGYGRCHWWQEVEGDTIYQGFGWVLPAYRGEGIGRAMLCWQEDRLHRIAADHPADGAKFFSNWAADTEIAKQDLLETMGYKPITYDARMVRDLNEPIPDPPLPAGLEVRPATEEHRRLVWEADKEAFRDHWGFSEPTEEDYETFRADPVWDLSLWQVAWDGDQIAGQVLCFIDKAENETYDRQRGWTEWISTQRKWRRQGVASHLICRGMRALKERGMEEAALGVHTENPNGAFQLYESHGYKVVKQYTTYRKPLT